jgi:hypothetical protein
MTIEKTIELKPNRLELFKHEFSDDFKDFDFKIIGGYSSGVELYYITCGSDGIFTENTNINSINSINNVDVLKLYAKNTTTETIALSFVLNYTSIEKQKCFEEFSFNNNLKLSSLGESLYKIEQSLNSFINANDGISCVTYFRTEATSTDHLLREFSSKKYVEKKKINLITIDNELPNLEDASVGDWGAEFNTFEAHIDKKYFESIFGKNTKPRDDDYIYIEHINMMFVVQSSILSRGINGKPTYWKLIFGNYNEDTTIENLGDDGFRDEILKHEELFSSEIKEEITDALNINQNVPPQIYRDLNRTMVVDGVIFNSDSYTMYGGEADSIAINYKNTIDNSEYCLAFFMRLYEDTKIFSINNKHIEIIDNKLVIFGRNSNISIQLEEKIYVLINVSDKNNSVHILSESEHGLQEISYVDNLVKPLDIPIGNVSLVFGQYDIGRIRIFNKIVPREYSARLMSRKILEKPSSAYIIDDAEDINNNPRAIESNYKVD